MGRLGLKGFAGLGFSEEGAGSGLSAFSAGP